MNHFLKIFRFTLLVFFVIYQSNGFAQLFAIKPIYDYADNFSDGLAAVRVGSKYGYINRDGKFVIPPSFDDAHSFSEGYARVRIGKRFGYIDKEGKLVIQPRFGDARDFKNGLAVVTLNEISWSGAFGALTGKGRWGAINSKGEFIVNPNVNALFDFNDGLAVASFGPLGDPAVGVLNSSGKVVVQPRFEYISRFSEGYAAALTVRDGWGYIRADGQWALQPRFDYLSDFQEGIAIFSDCRGKVHKPYDYKFSDCKSGFIDQGGRVVIDAQFSAVQPFTESRAAVSFSELGRPGSSAFLADPEMLWGYIDTSGVVVIDPIYREARPFREGVAAVRQAAGDRGIGEWLFIDKNGKQLVKSTFEFVGDVSEGMARVMAKSGKWGYISFQKR